MKHSPYKISGSRHTNTGNTTTMDTLTATTALREQMRAELNEVEEYERRRATAVSKTPNQQANFLLAASYLIQNDPTLGAAEAVEVVRSRFIKGTVQEALLEVKEKWHREWYFRPKEFSLGDEREREAAEEHARLHAEEKLDYEKAHQAVHDMLNFLTCNSALLNEWKQAFQKRALLQKNENRWTAQQFEQVLVQEGSHICGTEVPEGMGETIYNFLDVDERNLLHIHVFYDAVKDAALPVVQEKKATSNKESHRKEKKRATPESEHDLEDEHPKLDLETSSHNTELLVPTEELEHVDGNLKTAASPYVLKNDPMIENKIPTETIIPVFAQNHQVKHVQQLSWYFKLFNKVGNPWRWRRKKQQKQEALKERLVQEEKEHAMLQQAAQDARIKVRVEEERVKMMKDVTKLQMELNQVKIANENRWMWMEDQLSVQLNLLPYDRHRIGAMVRVNFAGRGHLYPGRIVEVHSIDAKATVFTVQYMDGDMEHNIPRHRITLVT